MSDKQSFPKLVLIQKSSMPDPQLVQLKRIVYLKPQNPKTPVASTSSNGHHLKKKKTSQMTEPHEISLSGNFYESPEMIEQLARPADPSLRRPRINFYDTNTQPSNSFDDMEQSFDGMEQSFDDMEQFLGNASEEINFYDTNQPSSSTISIPQKVHRTTSFKQPIAKPKKPVVPMVQRADAYQQTYMTRVSQVPLRRGVVPARSDYVMLKPDSSFSTTTPRAIPIRRIIVPRNTNQAVDNYPKMMSQQLEMEMPSGRKKAQSKAKKSPTKPKRLYKRKPTTLLQEMGMNPMDISLNDDFSMMASPTRSEETVTDSQKLSKVDPETGLTQDTMKKRRLAARYENVLKSEQGLVSRIKQIPKMTKTQLASLLVRGQKHLEAVETSEQVMFNIFENRSDNKRAKQRQELMNKKLEHFGQFFQQQLDLYLGSEQLDDNTDIDSMFKSDGNDGDAQQLEKDSPELQDLLAMDRWLNKLKKDFTQKQAIIAQQLQQIESIPNHAFLDSNVVDEKLPLDEQEQCARCRPIRVIRHPRLIKQDVEKFDSNMNVFIKLGYASDSLETEMAKYLELLALQVEDEEESESEELPYESVETATLKSSFMLSDGEVVINDEILSDDEYGFKDHPLRFAQVAVKQEIPANEDGESKFVSEQFSASKPARASNKLKSKSTRMTKSVDQPKSKCGKKSKTSVK